MKGRQIHNLRELQEAALSRRAVVCNRFGGGKSIPAAILMSQQGRILLGLFNSGVFLYEKEPPKLEYKKPFFKKTGDEND